ncbi:MAG: isoleucine--tRNA ligase [bacterium]|nr:MAG: isoleucine--tRNA ligase [bacterium]
MQKLKNYFKAVEPKPDFPKMERELLDHWYNDGIVDKYLNRNKKSKKYFSFQDGPITANNPMGVHHAWGRTYKDLWPRFKSMQGFRQRHQNGFDCQGLWVEVEVEKEQGFKSKKDIEKFGVDKFVALCKERAKKYSGIQTEQSKRLGYFADWDHSYYTLSDDNNYMIWHFLKVVHQNGWLYKGKDSVPWCPRCETAISQHEMLTEDYKEAVHESIYMKFPIQETDENLLVWTTTPWTIPANIAVAVDKKLDYVLVEVNDEKLWLAEEAKERVLTGFEYKELKKVKGSKLVGLKYKGLFDDLPAVAKVAKESLGKFHTVVETIDLIMPITTTEGTGLVHTAVSAGTEDFKLGRKLGLPMIPVINDDASYMDGFGDLSGQNAKKHPELILEKMKENNFSFKIERYKHRYPACWRCKSELVWKVTDEWYIAMDKPSQNSLPSKSNLTLRERMKDTAKKITWIPEFGLKRELDWLDNMHDWLISKKNRYWGLALPIWECNKCGNFDVVGGKEELKERTVSGWDKFDGKSPHKPQIDEVKIKCLVCGEVTSRIEPVGNPWLDAGIVQFSTISENNKASNFEVTDTKPLYLTNKKEWEKWFPVDFITESFPGQFKNWFYSMIAMSTVLENKTPFKTVLGFATQLGEDGRAMHKSWGNAIEFNEAADKIGSDVMRWMFARQDPATNMLFGYRLADDTRRQFHLKIWNIYNFFITYANLDRFTPSKQHPKDAEGLSAIDRWILARLNETVNSVTENLEKFDPYNSSSSIDKFVDDLSVWYIRRSRDRRDDRFYNTTYQVLVILSKLLAPFVPFIADFIYTNLTKEESVHLSSWPESALLNNQDKDLLLEMNKVREMVEVGHSLRKENNVPVRQPLSQFLTTQKQFETEELEQLILDELNVKSIKYDQKENKLDLNITPELEEEAKARELIRKIQAARKDMGVEMDAKINLITSWVPKNKELKDWLIKKTLVVNITEGEFGVSLSDEA